MKSITKLGNCKKQEEYHKLIRVLTSSKGLITKPSGHSNTGSTNTYKTHKRGLESIKAIRLKKEEAYV